MEALAAVGLASNITQFLGFAREIISYSTKLYGSADGALAENVNLEVVTKDLVLLNNKLKTAAPTDGDLGALCKSCDAVATELLELLDKLRVKGGSNGRWESTGKALRSVWSKDRIRSLEQRLADLRQELILRGTVDVRERLSQFRVDQPTRLPELEKAISDTIDNLIQQQAKFEEESQMLVALISSLRSQTSSVLNQLHGSQNGLPPSAVNDTIVWEEIDSFYRKGMEDHGKGNWKLAAQSLAKVIEPGNGRGPGGRVFDQDNIAEIRRRYAEALLRAGSCDKAREQFTVLVGWAEKKYGLQQLETLELRIWQASALEASGHVDAAIALFKSTAIDFESASNGQDGPQSLHCRLKHGELLAAHPAYEATWPWGDAEASLRQARDGFAKRPGSEREALRAQIALGTVLCKACKFDEAGIELARARQIARTGGQGTSSQIMQITGLIQTCNQFWDIGKIRRMRPAERFAYMQSRKEGAERRAAETRERIETSGLYCLIV